MYDPAVWLDRLATLPGTIEAADGFVADFEAAVNEPEALTAAACHTLMYGSQSLAGGVYRYRRARLHIGLTPILEARTRKKGKKEHYVIVLQIRQFNLRNRNEWSDALWSAVEDERRLRCVPLLDLLVTNLAVLNLATEII